MFRKSTYSDASGPWCVEVNTDWHKSGHSVDNGNCVQTHACPGDGEIWVRDSKDPTGPVLKFTAGEWIAFVKGAVAGEFDAPLA